MANPDSAIHEQGLQIKFVPLGHITQVVSTVAVSLPSLPDLARLRRVVIRNLDQPICWRDDGIDPTASTGMKALKDEVLVYDGSRPDLFKMIRATDAIADSSVRIAYYGT